MHKLKRKSEKKAKTFLVRVIAVLFLIVVAKVTEAKQSEAYHVDFDCKGIVEYKLQDRTRIDCLTPTHAIEYDFGKKWAEAIGQSLFYSAMTGKKAGIVLIVNDRTKERYLKRLNKTIEVKKLDIYVRTMRVID